MITCRGLAVAMVPKNACSSIAQAILLVYGIEDLDGEFRRHPMLRLVHPLAVPDDFYVAAFIRHPAARLVSAWADKIMHDRGRPTAYLVQLGYRIGMSFRAFAIHTIEDRRTDADLHIKEQVQFLPPRIDFCCRVENIADGWSRLQERFRWLPDLGRLNVVARDQWHEHYDEPLLAAVIERYRADYELWLES